MSMDCIAIGRLVKDAVDRLSNNGKVLHTFSIASNRGWGDGKQTDFIDCMAFAPILDKQMDLLKKGAMVKAVGHMQSIVRDNGQQKTVHWNFIVTSCEILFTPKKEERGPEAFEPEDIPF